jgi:hypothetical protein
LKRKLIIEESQRAESSEQPASKCQRRSLSHSSQSALFPSDKCIFCNKESLKYKGEKQKLTKCVTKTAEEVIKRCAEKRGDYDILSKVRDVDLVAREAMYHPMCRRIYTRPDGRNTSKTTDQVNIEHHGKAFEFLCEYIELNIIQNYIVESMTMLKERYLSFMQCNFPDSYNNEYKTCKLKSKIERRFGCRIKFWKTPKGELLYSAGVATGQAIESAFALALSPERQVEESGMIIRRQIFDCHKNARGLPWPPPPSSLHIENKDLPNLLITFLSHVLSENPSSLSSRAKRFIKSCSQDICASVTNGKWMLPKHLTLAMTVRHLTGSAELITLLNRLGHCRSYPQTLELETAICNAISSACEHISFK